VPDAPYNSRVLIHWGPIPTWPVLTMHNRRIFLSFLILSLACFSSGHDVRDEDQMPLGYYRYPYQAMLPGDSEGLE